MSQQLHIAGGLCTFLPSDAKDGNLHKFLNFKRGLTEKLDLAFSVHVPFPTVWLREGRYCCFVTASLRKTHFKQGHSGFSKYELDTLRKTSSAHMVFNVILFNRNHNLICHKT